MLFDEALQYLLSLGHETLAIKLGLRNIELLLAALLDPHTSYPSVQIAGTNGKGSTSVMLEAIARATGIPLGLYTSPHLSSITERIRINGREIAREDFARLATKVREASEALCGQGQLMNVPTFFEQVTAIALLAFREAKVDLAILETGLGGRLDATTAARAQIVAITPIGIDHQEYLGQTLSEIAAEKAAIIREGIRAVIAPQEPEALAVIERRLHETGVTPRSISSIEVSGADLTGHMRVTFQTACDLYEDVPLGLRGRHQAINAAVAIGLAETLRESGFEISRDSIINGLHEARHPGRLELFKGSPSVLFDGAHNIASARALRDYLLEFNRAPLTLIFGAMRDKELRAMADVLFPLAHNLILTEMKNPRAADARTLAKIVPAGFDKNRLIFAESVADALRQAFDMTSHEGLIAVTGSLYLVGEARGLLLKE